MQWLGKFFAIEVTAVGKGMAMFVYHVIVKVYMPPLAWGPVGIITQAILERIFSLGHALGVLAFNFFKIEQTVTGEVKEYLEAFYKAENLPKDASKEAKNAAANELFKKAETLYSLQRPSGLLNT